MYLLIDWGNTYLKLIHTQSLQLTDIAINEVIRLDSVESISESINPSIEHVLISSVRSDSDNLVLKQLLVKYTQSIHFAQTQAQACGVSCAYKEPETMGVDRWLGVIAASHDYDAVAIISIGSALTLDVVTNKRHLGGQIVPGYRLILDSLQQTGRVRPAGELQHLDDFDLGQSTTECVAAGVRSLFAGYLSELLRQCKQCYAIEHYLFAGGGGEFWAEELVRLQSPPFQAAPLEMAQLPMTTEYRPRIVFEGLVLTGLS